MRHFRNILFALAACLWLPASAHCQIEAFTGLQFLQCSSTSLAESSPCHDSGKSACCPVEKSQYNSEQLRVSLPTPVLFTVLMLAQQLAEPPLSAQNREDVATTAPPQLPQTWHFTSRTALPVRAPSFVS